jgi:hypothetical protein
MRIDLNMRLFFSFYIKTYNDFNFMDRIRAKENKLREIQKTS